MTKPPTGRARESRAARPGRRSAGYGPRSAALVKAAKQGPPTKEIERVCLAIPGQVVEVLDEDNQLAQVDIAGVRRTVNVGLLGDGSGARPGEWVLIHVGFALSRIDEQEAHATLALLRKMTDEYDQAIEELRTSAIQ